MASDADALEAGRLALRVDGPVAHITLNAPEVRNSQTPSLWYRLADIGANLPSSVRVVVIGGAGDCFSAGIDVRLLGGGVGDEESIHSLMQQDSRTIVDTIDRYQRGFTWLQDPRFITIAKVHGYAIGAGFQLALACDLRVVADDAWFCMKEPALGLVPDLAGTKPLVDLVGYSRALEICTTARRVSAEEASEYGLVTELVAAHDLDSATTRLVASILQNDERAVRETTALMASARRADLESQRLLERTAQVRCFRGLLEQAPN